MDNTLAFVDEGFLERLNKYFGNGKYLKFNKISFVKNLAKKESLNCCKIFYYTAPPFQSEPPTRQEGLMKEGYDKFIKNLKKEGVVVREGRCQKIINNKGEIEYKQKGVDVLLTIDLSHLKEDYPYIKKIILVSSDTDFCPIIKDIKKRENIEVILYSYHEKIRNSKFSVSNQLINCCSKYIRLSKQDFDDAPLIKSNEVNDEK